MKIRIMSAGVGAVIFFVAMYFFKTITLNVSMSLVTVIAIFEILKATKLIENKCLSWLCLIFGGIIPFMSISYFFPKIDYIMEKSMPLLVFVFVFLLFCNFLATHKKTRIEQIGLATLFTLSISFSFSTIVLLRNQFGVHGYFYILLIFSASWFADSGAYFVGRFFGKHKLAPAISPNKTIEGAIGGVVSSIVFSMAIGLLYSHFAGVAVNYTVVCLLAALGAVIGILGDLAASLIKRQYNIKDFGNLIPGHGGVMDRFDSVLFVAPFFYLMAQFFILIK